MRIERNPVGIPWAWMLTVALAIGPATMRGHAHVGDVVYPFTEITDEMLGELDLTDGSVKDWGDLMGEPTLTLLDFTADRSIYNTPERDPEDLDFRVWLGWHGGAGKLYLGVQVSDDRYVGGYDPGNEEDFQTSYDGISLQIDADHSGGLYGKQGGWLPIPAAEALETNHHAQWYGIMAGVSGGAHVELWPTSHPIAGLADWMVKAPYAEGGGAARGENPTIYIVEFAITPFDLMIWNDEEQSIVSDLAAGEIIGFNLRIADVDSKPGRIDGVYVLFPISDIAITADLFGDGLLLPSSNDTGGSVVESITWARIKAALSH